MKRVPCGQPGARSSSLPSPPRCAVPCRVPGEKSDPPTLQKITRCSVLKGLYTLEAWRTLEVAGGRGEEKDCSFICSLPVESQGRRWSYLFFILGVPDCDDNMALLWTVHSGSFERPEARWADLPFVINLRLRLLHTITLVNVQESYLNIQTASI